MTAHKGGLFHARNIDKTKNICKINKITLDNMSNLTYYIYMDGVHERVIIWLSSEVKTPPFSKEARREAGLLLRRLQQGENLGMPQSRPMPGIGARCHELRINDVNTTWRIIYQIYENSIVILEVFSKKTNQTPQSVIDNCKRRIKFL